MDWRFHPRIFGIQSRGEEEIATHVGLVVSGPSLNRCCLHMLECSMSPWCALAGKVENQLDLH